MAGSGGTSTAPADPLARVSGEVAAVLRRGWGRGPRKVTARWAGPDLLVLLLEDRHTDAEQSLRAAGHADDVLSGRRKLHAIVENELKTAVERIVGRPVTTVLGATRLDPDLSAEIFVFAHPGRGGGDVHDEPDLAARGEIAERRAEELGAEAAAVAAESRQQLQRSARRRRQRSGQDAG